MRLHPLDTLLDVGSGAGIFLEEFHQVSDDTRLYGLEPNPGLAEISRGLGAEIWEWWLESNEFRTSSAQFDCVTMFEVFEHLFDPATCFALIREHLNSAGWLFLTTLSRDGLDTAVLGAEHKNIYPPCHINMLSRRGFHALAARTGYQIVAEATPGELDVEILKRATDGQQLEDRFLELLFRAGDREVQALFQEFLRQARLSSHYWLLLQRSE